MVLRKTVIEQKVFRIVERIRMNFIDNTIHTFKKNLIKIEGMEPFQSGGCKYTFRTFMISEHM